MSGLKITEHLLAYLFVFYLGAKSVFFMIKQELTLWDYVSLLITVGFTSYFLYVAHNRNDRQIL